MKLTIRSKAISEQNKVLQKSSTRKTLRRVRDDTSSLYVQDDSASLRSQWTGKLSNFSKVFDFDRELFVSKVYENVIRTFMKPQSAFKMNDTLTIPHHQPPAAESWTSHDQKLRSLHIDRQLAEEAKLLRREVKIVLLGDRDHAQTFAKQMKIIHMGGFTTEELQEYQAVVRSDLRDIMEVIDSVIQQSNIEMDDITLHQARDLSRELKNASEGSLNIPLPAVEAIQVLWASEQLRNLWDSKDVYIPATAS